MTTTVQKALGYSGVSLRGSVQDPVSGDQRTNSENSPNEVKRSRWAVKTKSWMFKKHYTFSLNSPRIISRQSALNIAFQSRAIKNLLWNFSLIKLCWWPVFGGIINLFLSETYLRPDH